MNENESYNPLISVIIPVYKVEKYLHKCVDSVINQTYSKLEIILVDDGSPDNCGMICDEYSQKDSRIRVIHKENGGLSDARNAGLDIALGDYIGFVDSDDYIAPNMYEMMLQNAKKNKADISLCGYYNEYEGGIIEKNYPIIEKKVLTASEGLKEVIYSKKYGVMAWTKLYKKELFKNVRYPKGHVCEDVYVIGDIFENVKIAAFDSTSLYYYVHRNDSITTYSFNEKHLDWIRSYEHLSDTIRKSFPELNKIAKIRLLWGRLFVLDRSILTDNKELNKRIQKYVRKNILLCFDSFFTMSRRFTIIVAAVSLKAYKKIIMSSMKR